MERRLYDNSQFRHNTTDGHHGVIPNLRVLSVYIACIFFGQRSEGNQRRAEQKSLACPSRACGLQFSQSFLLQNTPYALSFLPSSLALRHFGFFLAWSVGLRRAPEFRARETGEVGYALEGIHGSVKVRWDLRIHASLS